MSRSDGLQFVIGKAKDLDESKIRKYLEVHDVPEWLEVLNDVKGVVLNSEPLEKAKVVEELRTFLDNVLKACVEGGLNQHLESSLNWYDGLKSNADKGHDLLDVGEAFKINNVAMIRACKKNDFRLVDTLYDYGFRHRTRLVARDNDLGGSNITEESNDVIQELTRLEAMSKPVYLLAQAKFDSLDPVQLAFKLLQITRDLAEVLTAFSNKLDAISCTLCRFTHKLLDLCEGNNQVELFLDQEDRIEGVSIKGTTLLPRIYEAIQLNHKDFITHDNCQQVVRRAFYDDGGSGEEDKHPIVRIFEWLVQVVMIPVYCIFYILGKLIDPIIEQIGNLWTAWKNRHKTYPTTENTEAPREAEENFVSDSEDDESDCEGDEDFSLLLDMARRRKKSLWQKLSRNLDVPVNRLITQVASYFFFISLILATMINPWESTNLDSLNFYDFISAVWAFGYICADVQLMFQISQSVHMNNVSLARLHWERFKKFFSNPFIDYRFISHTTFFGGICLEYTGYHFQHLSKLKITSDLLLR